MTAASNFYHPLVSSVVDHLTMGQKKYGELLDSVFALPAQGWILMERHCRHYL
jgi:hypothetical protein